LLEQSTCSEGLACVPDELRANTPPASCTVHATHAEGRCLPACLAAVRAQGAALAQDGCAEQQRCVPCYDPISGAQTAACGLADDAPSLPPRTFGACCGELGRCVPSELVPQQTRASLAADSCRAADDLCVPSGLVQDANFVPKSCQTSDLGSEGRCLPACLPALASQLAHLEQASCAHGELCAPCFDPRSGRATGSCALGKDPGPRDAPRILAQCCAAAGRCVPGSTLTAAQRGLLGRDSCSSAHELCLPEAFIDEPGFVPPHCHSATWGAEGRCLWTCLPSVATRADVLDRDDCAEAQRCVPCFDPIDGKPSGACEIGADTGPSSAPVLAANCCHDRGRCIPERFIPAESRELFAPDVCTGAAVRCVAPSAALLANAAPATRCHDMRTQAEGRCLPSCLPQVMARASVLVQADCAAPDDRCVPCFDPLSGAASGACSQGSDPGPTEPKRTFADCCSAAGQPLGACVPATLVPTGAPTLPAQSCEAPNVCAPRALIADPSAPLPGCGSALARGVCMATCFLSGNPLGGLLPQDVCRASERCVPCSSLGTAIPGCGV
jgi:hypothetical protein